MNKYECAPFWHRTLIGLKVSSTSHSLGGILGAITTSMACFHKTYIVFEEKSISKPAQYLVGVGHTMNPIVIAILKPALQAPIGDQQINRPGEAL